MARLVSVAAVMALWLPAVSAQPVQRRPVTVDDLMKLRSIVDVKVSPAGDRVAYAVSQPALDRNTHETAIFVVSADGRSPVHRVAPGASVFTPALPAPRLRWLPDGESVSFLTVSANRPQVMVAEITGPRTYIATSAALGVSAYEWSPDGKRLAYLARDLAPAPAVIRIGEREPSTRLWVKSRGGAARSYSMATEHVDSFSWAPDGSEIAFSAATVTGFLAPYSTRLYAVPIEQGARRTIVDRAGMNTSPLFSPDGQQIAFVTTNGHTGLLAPRGLAVVPAAAGKPEIKSFPMDGAWIGEKVWAPDSQSLFVLMNEGTFATGAHMFEMPAVAVSIADGRAKTVLDGAGVNYSLSVSADGRRLAYRGVDARVRTMGDVFIHDLGSGSRTRLTNVNPELSSLELGELKPISWRSFDGMEIWGLLLTPPRWDGKTTLPAIVYCHGGPIGGVTYGIFPQFAHTVGQVDPYPTEAMASAGYAVLFPMPRGGSGYGEAGHRMIINAWGEGDYKDIMAGVDHLVASKIADPNRLGVMGASYGGFMTNWIVTQTGRFKAASSGASISDLADLYYLPDGGDLMIEYFKRPWENRDSYIAHSPITHVEKVTTPILLQHGERDPRVPVASAQKFYRALKGLGKVVEYDFYPRGGHVLYEPRQQYESMRRNLEWFQQWIPTAPREQH